MSFTTKVDDHKRTKRIEVFSADVNGVVVVVDSVVFSSTKLAVQLLLVQCGPHCEKSKKMMRG